MIPKFQRKTIGQLQFEYLTNLLSIKDHKITLKQADYRLSMLNQYTASMYLNLKA